MRDGADLIFAVFIGAIVGVFCIGVLMKAYYNGAEACLKQRVVECVGRIVPEAK